MMKRLRMTLAGVAAILISTSSALAAGDRAPGDNGRPNEGIFPANAAPRPPNTTKVARAPAIDTAMAAVKAIAEGCRQYPLGVAVVNSEGVPVLTYIPDGSRAFHTYNAIRKAYSAVVFKSLTSDYTAKAQQGDPDVLARLKADPNLMAYSGGVPLKVGDEVIGAIGVSGAEPGGHDQECGLIGLEKIKGQLK